MTIRTAMLLAALATVLAGTACDDHATQGRSAGPSPDSAPAKLTTAAATSAGVKDGIRWMLAPDGLTDASTAVRDALASEHAAGRTLLVYVGATWCEPCQRFHHAVERGELDAAFPRLSVLAFDADRDTAALGAAGYHSRLIPLFAIPLADGHSSGKQIEGSVKGESAVSEITPRLRALVSNGS
jgi:thiol-disulfide isomerase/thioredoxin